MHGICKWMRRQNILKLIGIAFGIAAICYGLLGLGFGGWPEKLPGYANVVAGQFQSLTKLEAAAIRQIVAADNTTKRTIMWQSEVEESDAVLEYRLKGESSIMTLPTANTEFKDDKTLLYLHIAQLENLIPGRQYEYRIGYGDKRSDWNLLQTDTGKTVKALIFPDSQSNDYSDWENWRIQPENRIRMPHFLLIWAILSTMGKIIISGGPGLTVCAALSMLFRQLRCWGIMKPIV